MENLIEKLLIHHNYNNFNKKDISFQLKTHPNYPSFKSLSDTLDYFSIKNIVLQVPKDSLDDLPKYFITLINNESNLVLVSKKNDFIVTLDVSGKRKKYKAEKFKEIWSGPVIIIEEKLSNKIQLKYSKILYLISLLSVIALSVTKINSFQDFIFLFLSAIGIFISILIIREKIGYFSQSILNVCTKISSKNSCTDVIHSKGAKIYRGISLEDTSFLFFTVLFLTELFFNNNNFARLLIILSIPMVVYSIYYQGIVLKKWCVLCLIVGFISLILAFFYFYYFELLSISLSEVLLFLFIFMTISIFYFNIKNIIIKNKKLEEDLLSANKFKRNSLFLETLLKKSKKIKKKSLNENEIWIGKLNEDCYTIVAYTNPYCGFCKDAFDSYLRIINIYSNIIICFKFNTQPKDIRNLQTVICARLIEIYKSEGSEKFIEAYKNWFDERDEKKWLKLYGKPHFDDSTIALLLEHKTWSEENEINYTPATFLNDQLFPNEYNYEDLPNLINDIRYYQKNI